jgi:hypothetical protein
MALENQETLDLIKSRLALCKKTGILTWRQRDVSSFTKKGRTSEAGLCSIWNSRYAGKEAFTSKLQSNGTYRGRIDGFDFMKSRVVYALYNDCWPTGLIVHADGDISNFRPCNLMVISHSEKSGRSEKKGGKDTGFIGVYYRTHNGNKKRPCGNFWDVYFLGKFRGSYITPIEAAKVYDRLAVSHFGDAARTNLPKGDSK